MKKRSAYILILIVLLIIPLFSYHVRVRLVREVKHLEFNISYIQNSSFAAVYSKWNANTLSFALPVKEYYQKYSLSCEIASLKLALDYKGINVSEDTLISNLPFATKEPAKIDPLTGQTIWGDPNKGFVGNINGKMPTTGYGVYEKPILNVALNYRINSGLLATSSIFYLLQEVKNGNPVVVWGSVTSGVDISWHDQFGNLIKAVGGEHARVVVGFNGPIDAPTAILIIDPVYGKIQMPISDFIRDWALLGNKAVVVR
ncbi:MAG: C39 family peptidase [bacterium]